MKKGFIIQVALGIIAIATALGVYFDFVNKTGGDNLGSFSDTFLSVQLATGPDSGECLTTDGTDNVWSTCATGGGGGGDSVWSRNGTTGLIFSPTTTDAVAIGGNATSSLNTEFWFDPGLNSGSGIAFIKGRLGLGTTSPYTTLGVSGQVVADSYVATSTTATSTFAHGLSAVGLSSTNGLTLTGNINFAGDSIDELVGTGLQVVSGDLQTTLGTSIDISAETNLTAGDALTLTDDDIDFDGGATPSGDLGGTWASPSVTDDSHAHTGATLSGIDISGDTNLTAGVGITLTDDDLSIDTSQNIATLSNLTSNGFVKTSGGVGTLSVDTTSYQTLDSTLTSLAAFNTNGLLTQTAADTFTGRTITGTTNQITATNGNGVSGNPTLSIPSYFAITDINAVRATTTNATTTSLDITGGLTFNGVTGTTWASFCTTITGSADLCDGGDATGGGGGTGSNWQFSTNFGANALRPTTTIAVWAPAQFYASSTSMFQGLASFLNASSTQISIFDKAFFGGTATSSFDSTGALSLAVDLSVANGGTGASTLTGLLQGNGTSPFTAITNSSTGGQVLRVTGASTYAWGALDLADTDAITGTLPVGNGGTGATSLNDLITLGTHTTGNYLATLSSSGSITVGGSGSETAAGTVNLNMGNANIWTALQSFALASTSQLSVFNNAYFGATATSTFDSVGDLSLNTTGVKLSGSDGILTLLGLGNGNDENLTIDLDNATANTVTIASGTGVSTTTFSSIGVDATNFKSSATSTLAGLNLKTGGLRIETINCSGFTNSGKLTTDSSGNVICGNDTSGGGGGATFGKSWELTTDPFGVTALAPTTTVPIFVNSTATSSFDGGLDVAGFTAGLYARAPFFNATSTTATSTFLGDVIFGSNNEFKYNNQTGTTTITNLQTGAFKFDDDAGQVSWADLPILRNITAGTVNSYTAQIDGTDILTVYGENNGSGAVQNTRVGVASTTPWRTFGVSGTVSFKGLTTSSGTPSDLCINASTKEVTENAALTCTVSDRNQKNQISKLTVSALDLIKVIEPVQFAYNDNIERLRWGFIAQDLQAVDFRLGDGYTVMPDGSIEAHSIDMPALIALNTKAIKELDARLPQSDSTDTWQWVVIGLLALSNGYLLIRKK